MSLAEILHYDFTRYAFLVAVVACLPLGIVGTLVVVRRIGYLAGAIAHCALGGIGMGLFLKATFAGATGAIAIVCGEPIIIALAVSVIAAIVIGLLQRHGGEREDTAIGIVWATTMAAGLLCLDLTSGNANLNGYLFGDILLVSSADLVTITVLSVGVVLTTLLFGRRLEAACFDTEFAELRGVRPSFYFLLVLVLSATTVVLMIRIVGMLLIVALLTLPAATASRFTQRLFPMMGLASLCCLLSLVVGLYISCVWNLSSGPSIIAVATLLYGAAALVKRAV
ncbi:MAG: metal ABC transporter permease [Thermoguttaceae bacterium]